VVSLRLFVRNIALFLTLGLCFVPLASAQSGLSSYTLGAGDQVFIKVYGEEDLSVEALLNDAGSFSYPFLGELRVKGLTVSQLQDLIVDGLKGPYLVDPKVSVTILQYRRFYVRGEVEKSGGFPYEPGMTLQKAVSLAEGFTDRASRSKFYIVSDNDESDEPR
jgi:protein involved in polysaccharide export with SLBB domain